MHQSMSALSLNINPGHNRELMERCHTLCDYVRYVEKVRSYEKGGPLEEAVNHAIHDCIEEGILTDFLKRNKAEVVAMSIFEYDEELHIRTLKEESFEEGKVKGWTEGKAEAILELLQDTGEVPQELETAIKGQQDIEILRRWLKLAARVDSLEEFLQEM